MFDTIWVIFIIFTISDAIYEIIDVILDLFGIFPYGIGRIPVKPESTIPGLNYLYAIGFSYLFAIIMSIINPKRTILWLFAIPPVALIYRILRKITKYYKK